jgi:hypothetical protein
MRAARLAVLGHVKPPLSPDLVPLDACVRMKNMVYERKRVTRAKILERIFGAERHLNNPTVFHEVTCSLVKRTGQCIQADGGCFEQLL